MSEPKNTPGPWKVIDNRPKVDYPVKKGMEWVKNTIEIVGFKRYTGELTCVARIDHRIGYYPIDDEDMANADLLADAWQLPDLRRENAELKVLNKDMYEALDHLRIAAQKVCDDFCCGAGCSQDARDCKLEGGLIRAEIALRKARGERE